MKVEDEDFKILSQRNKKQIQRWWKLSKTDEIIIQGDYRDKIMKYP